MDEKKYNYKNIEIGVGLNQVDNLKPSKYFYEVVEKSHTYDEAEAKLNEYYKKQVVINQSEKECDIIAIRIAKLLEEKSFTFSPATLKTIHRELFSGVFEGTIKLYVGIFRDCNLTKNEEILSGKSVIYGDYSEILDCLEYDFDRESKKDYSKMSINEQISNISKFVSNIWQVHPFREGNTRTTAIFTIKYLNQKGFDVNNELFKENAKYFRNALVLANYSDLKVGFGEDRTYLESFFTKLIVDKNFKLKELKNPYEIKEKKSNDSEFNPLSNETIDELVKNKNDSSALDEFRAKHSENSETDTNTDSDKGDKNSPRKNK